MFDALLGGKFSNKCKYYVKCVNSRLSVIKKKKQATVKFLKKDITDLLARNRDDNAFRRIEPLIVEINHAYCYDMIEQYCQDILKQLPSLQKKRECPEEAMEAVSTLIFSAARVPDLPELSDLRKLFLERYGSSMEKSVNTEFVEKMQKKSFSVDRKLQFMQAIADEFSVEWDLSRFQQETQNSPALPSVQPKGQIAGNMRHSFTEMNGRTAVVNEIKEAVYDISAEDSNQKAAAASNACFAVYNRKEALSAANTTANERKQSVFDADVGFNRKKGATFNANTATYRRSEGALDADVMVNRRKAVFDADIAADRKKGAAFNANASIYRKSEGAPEADVAVNRKKDNGLNAGGEQEASPRENGEHNPRIFNQNQVQPVLRDIHVVPRFFRSQTDVSAAAAEKTETLEVGHKVVGALYLKPKGSLKDIEIHYGDKRSPIAHQEPGLIGIEKKQLTVNPLISRDVKAVKMVSPYTESKDIDDLVATKVEARRDEERRRLVNNPVDSKDGKLINMRPPYTKPSSRIPPSTLVAGSDLVDVPISSSGTAADGEERHGPVSVRRKHTKPTLFTETNKIVKGQDEKDLYKVEIEDGQQRKAEGDRQRRRGARQSGAAYDGNCDEEEMAMDRLLSHYSKKRMEESSKTRTTRPASHHHPERVASLPRESTRRIVVEDGDSAGKGYARAASLNPDGGRSQPRVPDHNDSAARFAALKKV